MLSTLSRKILICLTGLFLAFFLLIHFLGNLQLFLPAEEAQLQFNAYSHFLSGNILIKMVSYILYASIIIHAVDGLIIKISNNNYGFIKNGILVDLQITEVPETFKMAFQAMEQLPNPPKYPYALEIKESTPNVKSTQTN